MSLSETLKQAVKATGLSLYRVGLDSGVPDEVLGRWLKGERGITLASADKLADYFGLELTPRKAKGKGRGK